MNSKLTAIGNDTVLPIVEVNGLCRSFGSQLALDNIHLRIQRGGIFGLVGVNGAGKTTLIKHILGLYKSKAGRVSVFGLDPISNTENVLARIGYMSEVTELPDWMTVAELIRYTRAFYPQWDESYSRTLTQQFELDTTKKIRNLSKGQRARVALLLAVSHRPELLILDEPSSGLDPLVRRDILRTVIQAVADDGRTVLFSSHLLDEVERVADTVALIDSGNIVIHGELDELKRQYHQLSVSFETDVSQPPVIDGLVGWQGGGKHWAGMVRGELDLITELLQQHNGTVVHHSTPTLDQLFVALVGDNHRTLESAA